jgi:hypothetical protein
VVAENSLQSRILKSFDRYRQPSASALMKALGKRLVGELLGETEYEFDDFVVDGDTIATSGVMSTLLITAQTLTTTPVGLFLRFSGDRTISEVAFMGTSETADLSTQEMPSVDALRAALPSS